MGPVFLYQSLRTSLTRPRTARAEFLATSLVPMRRTPMQSSPRSDVATSSTASDGSSSPLDDRLHALTQSPSSDEYLPQIRGVHLLRDGQDAGLYQISVTGYDGARISLGCSHGIEKASEIHDMVALGLHGSRALLNFSPRRYPVETYLNVLLTFQKLFPANFFWDAVQRGIDAGMKVDGDSLRTNPILNTFFSLAASQTKTTPETSWIPRPVARWPPFCPPWLLSQSRTEIESAPVFDATAMVRGVSGSDSRDALSGDDTRLLRKRRVYRVPSNGVVAHRAAHPFVPPEMILHSPSGDLADAARKTRRGRSVKQPMRYREDTQMYFSDSDSIDRRSLQRPERQGRRPGDERAAVAAWIDEGRRATRSAIPVVKTPSTPRCTSLVGPPERRVGSHGTPLLHSPTLQCYGPLHHKRLC